MIAMFIASSTSAAHASCMRSVNAESAATQEMPCHKSEAPAKKTIPDCCINGLCVKCFMAPMIEARHDAYIIKPAILADIPYMGIVLKSPTHGLDRPPKILS